MQTMVNVSHDSLSNRKQLYHPGVIPLKGGGNGHALYSSTAVLYLRKWPRGYQSSNGSLWAGDIIITEAAAAQRICVFCVLWTMAIIILF